MTSIYYLDLQMLAECTYKRYINREEAQQRFAGLGLQVPDKLTLGKILDRSDILTTGIRQLLQRNIANWVLAEKCRELYRQYQHDIHDLLIPFIIAEETADATE